MLFFWLELGKRFHGAFKLMRMDFSTSCNNIVVRRVISQTAYVLRHTARFGRKADVDAELDGLDSRTEGCPADRAHRENAKLVSALSVLKVACVNNYRVPDKGYYNCETPEAPLGAALTKGKGAAEMHMDVMDHGLDRSIAKEKKEEKKNKGHLARKERIVMTDTWTVTRWVTAFTTHLKERRLGIRDQGILCDSLTEMVISGCDLKDKKRLEALKNYISFLEHRL
ncbi:unnamed protein product [Fusarium graminearum]|uniref:Uncharacterized protein n=1 Tax=Gibberella zeae TaxID=5518 RepID=A0A8H3QCJ1_GIBZA|nr:unnamed protein product [Fusarium graminearum]CAF3617297.1 unnamed protein product [Fusarium graminearum]CAG1987362.1 unnamed protein product [Fusarium graminearum]CAG2011194.1 unnamed protein product [Fusarium graminearum]